MNLILLRPDDYLDPQRVRLSDARAEQIRQVHRAQAGDSVRVGDLGGLMGSAIIEQLDEHAVTLRVALDRQPPAKLPVTLVLALPRPKMARRICRTIAELGVRELILINSYRVEKSYWSSPLLSEDRIQDYFIEGLQQSMDTALPTLRIEKYFKPFVEDRLPALASNKRALVAHPRSDVPCPRDIRDDSLLAIGPEGGFIPYELEKLEEAGLQAVTLGERILKVETAVPVLLSRLFS